MIPGGTNRILTIDSGSSSVKPALDEMGEQGNLDFTADVTGIGQSLGRLTVTDSRGKKLADVQCSKPMRTSCWGGTPSPFSRGIQSYKGVTRMATKGVKQVKQDKEEGPQAQMLAPAIEETTFEFDATLSTAVKANGKRPTKMQEPKGPLSPDLLDKMNRYWFAANYLCVGQIYLSTNPLLREPIQAEQIKPRLLGHWGTSAGQNFIYVHLNRLIKERDASVIYIARPGSWRTIAQCAFLLGRHVF